MLTSLVEYDDRPSGKLLPSRGTLFASRPEAVGSNRMRWFLLNITLFFLPGLCALLGILIFGNQLGIFTRESPLALYYTLVYCMFLAGSEAVFIADDFLAPSAGFFDVVTFLFSPSLFWKVLHSFLDGFTARKSGSYFTIFIMGFRSRSLPILVDRETTIEDIYQHLKRLCLVPRTGPRRFYFTYLGRRIAWDATIGTLGLNSLSHLHLNFSVPGGAAGSPEAGSSRPARKINRSKMASAIDELGATDSDDAAPAKKRKRRAPRQNDESRTKSNVD
ncbi:hypothetical protein B0H10DRAFT_1953973 [Mycena sp. CBHHK59/15]|nr:hypothetical protein B0H10DRAFT_1961870 [Mycena sp. CBHHK59/15]KAJ6610264.1 hypothetical protein B0H10DRAFT_1953973 [Mycena sp. CBHHK59/15]